MARINDEKAGPSIGETNKIKQLEGELMTINNREEVREWKVARQKEI